MELTLTSGEREFLMKLLERHDRGLLKEIWHTDSRDFKVALREDAKILESILSRLRDVPIHEAHH